MTTSTTGSNSKPERAYDQCRDLQRSHPKDHLTFREAAFALPVARVDEAATLRRYL